MLHEAMKQTSCYHSVDMNGAISLVNRPKGYFRITVTLKILDMIQNPPCDTRKLYHEALLPVQLAHPLERTAAMHERLTATRFVARTTRC